MNLGQLLLNCRTHVCETFYYDGPQPALAAMFEVAVILAQHIDESQLSLHLAWDTLHEVSVHLRLVELFGQDAVTEAMASGARTYAAYKAALELARAA